MVAHMQPCQDWLYECWGFASQELFLGWAWEDPKIMGLHAKAMLPCYTREWPACMGWGFLQEGGGTHLVSPDAIEMADKVLYDTFCCVSQDPLSRMT